LHFHSHYRLTYQLIHSEPTVDVLSVIHKIRLHRVSWDPEANSKADHTFIELSSDFSQDATQPVLQDSKWTKHAFVVDLRTYLEKGGKIDKKKAAPKTSTKKPDFTGVWVSVKEENLAEFLKSQGFTDTAAETAAKQQMVQAIKQTSSYFRVSTNGHVYSYLVGGVSAVEQASHKAQHPKTASEEEAKIILSAGHASLSPIMIWDGNILVSATEEPTSLITRRLMVGEQLCVVMQNKTTTCKRYFELVPPEKQTEKMKEYARQAFTGTDDLRIE